MTKFLFVVLFLSCTGIKAQETVPKAENSEDDKTIYKSIELDKLPEYPGGIKEFYDFIGRNYIMPKVRGLKGKVFATFVIEKDGELADIKIIRDIGSGTGEELKRVLRKCTYWKPGEKAGKKVRVLYALPLSVDSND